LFQTDRLRIRSNDQFVPAFLSYSQLFSGKQYEAFSKLCSGENPQRNYLTLYNVLITNTKYFGRYSMFLWLECLARLTGLNILPDRLDWQNANNCLNGLLLAFHKPEVDHIDKYACAVVDDYLKQMIWALQERNPERRTDIWNVETTLCAYYKYRHGKRFVGYYIKRQKEEIDKMMAAVPKGVCWDVLYDFREEYFSTDTLKQFS
jgi:hypothetical protein